MIKIILFLFAIGFVVAVLILCFIYVNYIFNKKEKKDEQGRNNRLHNRRITRIGNLFNCVLLEQGEQRMTKEELEKEAEEIANKRLCSKRICYNHCNFNSPKHHRCGEWHRCYECAIAGAEPREKQIQIDARQIRALQKQNGELTDKVKELEQQIEKMQEKLKADLIARLEEQMQYSTSPSCTKGMELFIKSIEKWEIKEK